MALQVEAKLESNRKRKQYLELLNKFRAEYFNDPNIKKYKLKHWDSIRSSGIIPLLLFQNNTPIGCVELTVGNSGPKSILNLTTVYFLPKYRSQGYAYDIYRFVEAQAERDGMWFGIHIEQSSLLKNLEKFKQLGFVCADRIADWGTDHHYNETTWILFSKYYAKRFYPLGNIPKIIENELEVA
jgi:GNAT superfamily N-acetyltransferase